MNIKTLYNEAQRRLRASLGYPLSLLGLSLEMAVESLQGLLRGLSVRHYWGYLAVMSLTIPLAFVVGVYERVSRGVRRFLLDIRTVPADVRHYLSRSYWERNIRR